jgi:NAD(P)-dependent dehydrogenase (short-subunit alcohol dehydrogenase family)
VGNEVAVVRNLAGKGAFITGGANGIGFGIAEAFLRQGMRVAIADIDKNSLASAVLDLAPLGEVRAIEVDVCNREDLEAAADEAEAAFGKIHVVCNNAGIGCAGPGHLAPVEQWDRVMRVNLYGTFHGIQVFVPRILKHGEGGHVVNTSSLTGLYPNPSQFVYGASKYAIVGMSEFLRDDLAGDGISVSVLCPNTVLTSLSAFKPLPTDTDEIRARRSAWMEKRGIVLETPERVGDMVVRGILEDELYIFTDGKQSRERLIEKSERILAAFDRQFPAD